MPGVLRITDLCSGHGPCWESRKAITGSPDVYTDGLKNHRLDDLWEVHGSGDCDPHEGSLSSGSETVFTNGLPQGRIGDSVNCGSIAITGSETVFVD